MLTLTPRAFDCIIKKVQTKVAENCTLYNFYNRLKSNFSNRNRDIREKPIFMTFDKGLYQFTAYNLSSRG